MLAAGIYDEIGVLEGIRTPDPRFRKPVLYPAELPRRVELTSIGQIWNEGLFALH
jgi:hypothetical protein